MHLLLFGGTVSTLYAQGCWSICDTCEAQGHMWPIIASCTCACRLTILCLPHAYMHTCADDACEYTCMHMQAHVYMQASVPVSQFYMCSPTYVLLHPPCTHMYTCSNNAYVHIYMHIQAHLYTRSLMKYSCYSLMHACSHTLTAL